MRPIPPAGCYFYRVMNKPQYRGGGAGRAGLFTSAGAGRAERSSLSTARPLRAQWVPCAAREARGGQQSRAGMQTGPGEAACEHTGWLLKMGEFFARADKGGYSPRRKGAQVLGFGRGPSMPADDFLHFQPLSRDLSMSQWAKPSPGALTPLLIFTHRAFSTASSHPSGCPSWHRTPT